MPQETTFQKLKAFNAWRNEEFSFTFRTLKKVCLKEHLWFRKFCHLIHDNHEMSFCTTLIRKREAIIEVWINAHTDQIRWFFGEVILFVES